MSDALLRVALPVPLPKLFDYLLPESATADEPRVGCRVRVPFGRTRHIGVVVERVRHTQVPRSRLKSATQVLDAEPLLLPADLDFLHWCASYYHHPIGEVVSAALPLRLRKQDHALPIQPLGFRLRGSLEQAQADCSRAPRQRTVLETLATQAGGMSRAMLQTLCGEVREPLRRLLEKGWVEECALPAVPQRPQEIQRHVLSVEQESAVTAVRESLGQYAAFLLQGVTGSGKTEVYLQLAEAVLARGQQVLILVPEISLTPQLQTRFAERFGDAVAVMHSALADGERELAWQRIRLGETAVVLGTRSLVFNPFAQLGLVVVDEEHDASFKQQEGFRYSARDLALVRAQRAQCPVILGSATPSLESLSNVERGRYQLLRMDQRAGGARAPQLNLLDVRDQPLRSGVSEPLRKALAATLAAGEQAILFINRRGFAPVLSCFECGWLSDCPRCDAHQTVHRASQLLWCHHCGSQRRVPKHCPDCGSEELHPLGQGTEQIEGYLGEQFPDTPIIRVDRDATARKGSLDALLQQVHEGGPALLVGTQMLAKGHHFPRVTLVGVLDVDGGLFSADFRAPERMAQLLLQVAGRAGRGELPGRVLIQTRYPEHPLLQTLVQRGYDAFAEAALAERREAGFPPFGYQALLRAEANKEPLPAAFLQAVLDAVILPKGVEAWGPVPAPMARRVGRYRAHLLLQAEQRVPLHRLLKHLRQQIEAVPQARSVRWSLDVDPLDTY